MEASVDAGAKSSESRTGRRGVLFEASQPHPHVERTGLGDYFMREQEDVAVAAGDAAFNATPSEAPILKRIRPVLGPDPRPLLMVGDRCGGDARQGRGGGDQKACFSAIHAFL